MFIITNIVISFLSLQVSKKLFTEDLIVASLVLALLYIPLTLSKEKANFTKLLWLIKILTREHFCGTKVFANYYSTDSILFYLSLTIIIYYMNLPQNSLLPVSKLAASFGNTSATYKFYWLLAILELVEEGQVTIPKRHLFARMIGNAWYTVNYFHVSFGKQDLIQQAVKAILEQERLTLDTKKSLLLSVLENSELKTTQQTLSHFNKNVPHWFLSPWFAKVGGENDVAYRKRICASSQVFENDCLYALYDDHIVINPNWIGYLKANAKILKDFVYWNLTLFLQVRNPNVPDIANKLIRPPFRGSLTNQRKNYWDIVFKELGTLDCIFTNTALTIDRYALDHFVPHAFVSHDLIWNLLPIDTSFNSTKSDKLPNMETHFDGFFKLQKTAFEIITHYNPKNKLLEEYLTIYPDLVSVDGFEYSKYKESIQPLVTIANNNGFGYLV